MDVFNTGAEWDLCGSPVSQCFYRDARLISIGGGADSDALLLLKTDGNL